MKRVGLGCVLITLAALLGGCSGGGNGGGPASSTPMALQGVVHGGQAPIVGATVALRVASEQGLAGSTILTTSTTDSNGNFTFNFTCPSPSAQMYVTGAGGNSGGGSNTAIHLMVLLGPCASMHGSVTLNELTTVAAAYAANGFIRPSGCADCSGGLPQSIDNISGTDPGLSNAMGNAALLVSPVTGLDAPTLPTSAECPSSGTVPPNCLTVRKLNTAANALAACVNSSGPTSAQCTQLFDCATVGAVFTSSTACTPVSGAALPTNTLQAMLNIVRNPVKVSIPGIDDTSNRDVVFSPAFTTHFTDYTMPLAVTGGGMNYPFGLAVDGAGDIWIANNGSSNVTELSPNGVPLSGIYGFPVGGFPSAVAFDTSGNAWVTDQGGADLTVLDPFGTPVAGSPFTGGGLNDPRGIAASPNGYMWATNYFGGNVSLFSPAGVADGNGYPTSSSFAVAVNSLGDAFVTDDAANTINAFNPDGTTLSFPSGNTLNEPEGVAIDINGNLWVGNTQGDSLTKFTMGNPVTSVAFTGGGLSQPHGIAIDAAGNVWVADFASLSEFSNAGVALSPSAGFDANGLHSGGEPIATAVDPSGNVWVASANTDSVVVFIGAAAPTRTPLVAAISQGFAP